MSEVFLEKNAVRMEIKETVKIFCQDPIRKLEAEKSICENIVSSEEYKKTSIILAYSALKDEVDLTFIIKKAYSDGKKVALPVVQGDLMNFYLTDSSSVFKKGAFGIKEPSEKPANLITKDNLLEKSLILVPGRAFTKDGKRLGRGKGYYDKWFSAMEDKANQLVKWGICFSCQLVENLPSDKNDIPVDKVIF